MTTYNNNPSERAGIIHLPDTPITAPWTGGILILELLNKIEAEAVKIPASRRGQIGSLLEMLRRQVMLALAGGKE